MEGKSYNAPTKKDLEQENGESENSEDELQPMENASTKDLIEEVSDLHLERCMCLMIRTAGLFFFHCCRSCSKDHNHRNQISADNVCLVSSACGFLLITLQTFEKGIVLEKRSWSLIEAPEVFRGDPRPDNTKKLSVKTACLLLKSLNSKSSIQIIEIPELCLPTCSK